MKKKVLLIGLIIIFVQGYAQTSDSFNESVLKNLKEINLTDISKNQQAQLDLTKIPIYNNEGKKIKIEEFQKLISGGSYLPHPYVNKKGKVKLIVVRLTTQKELRKSIELTQKTRESEKLLRTIAPSFSAIDINGNEYNLESLKGKIVVLNFWFIACKPCIEEMPDLNKLVEKYKDKEVVFLAITPDKKRNINTFLKQKEFNYNIILDRNLINSYRINVYPTHLIIDKNSQKVIFSTTGLNRKTVSNLDAKISTLLKK